MLKIATMITALFLTASCTTSGGTDKSSTAKVDFADQPIVLQTSGKSLLRQLPRDRWVQIRNTSKNESTKLYANLGAAEWDVAVSDARAYLQNHPQDEVALTVLSLGLAMKQNYPLAAYYARLLEKYHPGNPEVKNILGLAEMSKPGATFEDYKEAIAYFESAFNTSQQQIASGMNLAQLHLEMGNLEAARDVYQAVQSRCACNDAALGYGISLARLQDYAKAEGVLNEVLKSDKHNPFARYYLALIAKYGKSDNQGAINQLQAMLDDSEIKNLEMQRKANFLLRRIQAQVYGQPKDKARNARPTARKKSNAPISDVKAEDIESEFERK